MTPQRTLQDQLARERSARFQAEQWQKAGRTRTAIELRRHADALARARNESRRTS